MARSGVKISIYQMQFFLEFAELAQGLKISEAIAFDQIKILTNSKPQNDRQSISENGKNG